MVEVTWGTLVERERRRRIRVSVAAYAYEVKASPIMSDADFDHLCLEINPMRSTDNDVVDAFFRKHFSPSTGMWVRSHPDVEGLARIYDKHWSK